MRNSEEKRKGFSESFVIGAVAVVFLITGYQTALFVHQAAVMRITANRDEPDTVYIYAPPVAGTSVAEAVPPSDKVDADPGSGSPSPSVRKYARHSPRAEAVRMNVPRNKVECFSFNPNTVPVEDLCRLGFTLKQAQSIDNYRRKGGRFCRKEDFARSFVVSDSIYRRLEPYIDIPLIDLNLADSADFDALPGVGSWFASKMIEHRKALGGYSCKEQLLDIHRFDRERYDGLSDLITVSHENITPYPLWSLPADSLCRHPYIANYETARAIVLFRDSNPRDRWTIDDLLSAGILSSESARRLSCCLLR